MATSADHGRAAQPAQAEPQTPVRSAAYVSAAPAERVVARLRSHARALFWPSIVLIAVAGAVGYLSGSVTQVWQTALLFGGAALVTLLLFLLPMVFWLGKRYVITTRRIILRHGFFVRVRQELLHSRGYDIAVAQNWLQSAFRCGDVRISSGREPTIVLRDVPRPDLVLSALNDLMEHTRNPAPAGTRDESVLADQADSWQTTVWGSR
ncbi:MAG: PH domain-containing protein [Microbacteriaceae bacterium]